MIYVFSLTIIHLARYQTVDGNIWEPGPAQRLMLSTFLSSSMTKATGAHINDLACVLQSCSDLLEIQNIVWGTPDLNQEFTPLWYEHGTFWVDTGSCMDLTIGAEDN